MKRKRLDRDLGWGFQYFPYYQTRLDCEDFHGLASLIDLTSGEYMYWGSDMAVAGEGMKWLQLVPDGKSRLITAMYLKDRRLSVCYVDIIERIEYDPDGVAAYVDKYLDVVFTPQGDAVLVDRDELDEAFAGGDITKYQYEGAIKEGEDILSELCTDIPETVKQLDRIFSEFCSMTEKGGELKPMMTKYQKTY